MKIKSRRHKNSKTYLDQSTILVLKQVGIGFLVLLSISLILFLVWWSTRLPAVTLSEVVVEGGLTIDHTEVKRKVTEQLQGSYIGLIPKSFAYFYPKKAVETVVESVPRSKNINIFRQSGKTLKVTFDEYVPESLWCPINDSSNCLFLDADGYAFAPAPELQGGSLVRYYTTEREPKEKETPFSVTDFSATKRFVELLESIDWYVTKIEINQVRDVFYTLTHSGELKATLTDTPEKTFENLQTILNSKEFSHLKSDYFQYLDLRFGTRVFVNEELLNLTATSTASTTATSTDVIEVLE